jgi:prolipoprotein diacylglyceryltransferase
MFSLWLGIFSQSLNRNPLPVRENSGGIIWLYHWLGIHRLSRSASHGAAISIIIAMYYFSKIYYKTFTLILDRVVIAVASGAIFVRLGNFFNSEIIGKETNSTFGIKFIRDQFSPRDCKCYTNIKPKWGLPSYCKQSTICQFTGTSSGQHPAQLYEAFCYVFVLRSCFSYTGKQKPDKIWIFIRTFLVLLFSYIVVEYVKESHFESTFRLLSTGQWLSIPFIIGLYFIFTAENQ